MAPTKMCPLKSIVIVVTICLILQIRCSHTAKPISSPLQLMDDLLFDVHYPVSGERELELAMRTTNHVQVQLEFNGPALERAKAYESITVIFDTRTLTPRLNILKLNPSSARIVIKRGQINTISKMNYKYNVSLELHAEYIGHAIVEPVEIVRGNTVGYPFRDLPKLRVRIEQHDGVLGKIFIVSVIILMTISYYSLGAQLDTDNVMELIKKPKTLMLGYLISVLIMPLISWSVANWLLSDQILFRIGSYIYACGPAATATTLWAVVLRSAKELSIGLQCLTTLGAVFTMPLLMYIMGVTLNGSTFKISMPHVRTIFAMLMLMFVLIVGRIQARSSEYFLKLSRKIFKPLIFSVLAFIIGFSLILYWHIYQMFDLNIFLATSLISLSTFLITSVLGYAVSCNYARAISISISSVYKNSGVAIAVLLIAFEHPDNYIAFVPCLAQVLFTSACVYVAYTIIKICECVTKRKPTSANESNIEEGHEHAVKVYTTSSSSPAPLQQQSSNALGRKENPSRYTVPSIFVRDEGEHGEFLPMDVGDVDGQQPNQPLMRETVSITRTKTVEIRQVETVPKENDASFDRD